MTPIWIFPACPLLIIGPHAGVLCKTLKPSQALDIIIGGYTEHGLHKCHICESTKVCAHVSIKCVNCGENH